MKNKALIWSGLGLVVGFVVGVVLGSNAKKGLGDAVDVEAKGSRLIVTVDGGQILRSSIGL